VAIWVNVVQPAPWHRSTRYPATPTLSVEAVQLTVIDRPTAVAVTPPGTDGGVVSGSAGVVALTTVE
jgi:hypothetical protein